MTADRSHRILTTRSRFAPRLRRHPLFLSRNQREVALTLIDLCAPHFAPEVWARGLALFHQGHITLTQTDADSVMATAQPGQEKPFDIRLVFHPSGPEIKGFCTCPDYGTGKLCHHIWATLLAAEATGWNPDVWPTYDELIVNHQDKTMDRPSRDFASQRSLIRSLFGSSPPAPRGRVIPLVPRSARKPPIKASPNWQELLRPVVQQASRHSDAPRSPTTPTRPRQAGYVVNVAMSLDAGGLYIEYHHQEQRQDGTFGKMKSQSLNRADLHLYPSPDDQRLLQLLLGHRSHDERTADSRSTDRASERPSHCIVAPILYDTLVPELCATGRFMWRQHAGEVIDPDQTLKWDAGPAWQLKLVIETDTAKQRWRLHGQLVQDPHAIPLSEAVLLLADGLALFPTQVGRLDASDAFAWIVTLRKAGEIDIPFSDREAFLQWWWSIPPLRHAELPPELDLPTEPISPTGVLTVFAPPNNVRDQVLYATVSVHYDDYPVDLDAVQAGIIDFKQQRVIPRVREAELALLTQLSDLGMRANRRQDIKADYQFSSRQLPALTEALLDSGWIVEADGRRMRPPGVMSFQVTAGVDWFELKGQVTFGDMTIELPILLRALRQGERFVRLGDGSQGLLPETWLTRYGQFADFGQVKADTIRFKPSQALLLDVLLAEHHHLSLDPAYDRWRQQLQNFDGIQPASPPESFQGQLRPYQQEGLGWLYFLRDFQIGGCLADDMGLGKTVQVLALLASRQDQPVNTPSSHKPSIVVVPRSLVFNWQLEAKRFTPTLRMVNYTGPNRSERLDQLADTDVLITTYGTLRLDIVKLKTFSFDYAILDESQAIKNANSQVAKASRLLQADHRLAMTGTPVENHLGELWSLFEFLNPGMLGRSTVFNRMTKRGPAADSDLRHLLAPALRPFMLRRTKTQVLTDLPEKTEQTLFCEMPDTQRQLYDELRGYYRTQLTQRIETVGLKRSKIQVLEALLRLRQAACHPGLIDTERRGDRSAKIETLLEQLEELVAEGHKALVFSQFTSLLAIVREQLNERDLTYAYLDGRTRKRQERVEQFQQDPSCPLFLISLKAGGHGLNLTAADYVFILDPWWNPAVEAQAIDRAHRIGQTQPVFAYRLICRDTVEEKILTLQQSKRELADSIVSADANLMRHLKAEDLQLLLS